ncbi:MAG: T9SS type A sorting domain-containing protein [Saprospiraceae bacterium]
MLRLMNGALAMVFVPSAESPMYVYFQNGEYTVTLTASSGCGTSVFEQTINIASPPHAAFTFQYTGNCDLPQAILIDVSYSDPETWQWIVPGGIPSTSDLRYPMIDFPAGGEYEVTLIAGNANGFDTLTNIIFIEGPVQTEVDVNVCVGSVYNGVLIDQDTTLVFDLTTGVLGCDSTVTAHIIVVDELQTFQFTKLCEGEIFHGIVLSQDTILIETFTSQGGCDSIVTTDVRVFPIAETFLMEEIEDGEFIQIGNSIFNETGQYDVTLQTADGCDSIVYLDLNVLVGSEETLRSDISLNAFPNPFGNQLKIEFTLNKNQPVTISIFDITGREISNMLEKEFLSQGIHRFVWQKDMLGAGVFLVKVQTADGLYISRVVGF